MPPSVCVDRRCQELRFSEETACSLCGGTFSFFYLGETGQILQFLPPDDKIAVTPLSIEFLVGGDNCGATSSTVMLNSLAQGSFLPARVCACTTCTTSLVQGSTFDFIPSGPNTITMQVAAGSDGVTDGVYQPVATIQVCLEYDCI
jgi:hypothetical protein